MRVVRPPRVLVRPCVPGVTGIAARVAEVEGVGGGAVVATGGGTGLGTGGVVVLTAGEATGRLVRRGQRVMRVVRRPRVLVRTGVPGVTGMAARVAGVGGVGGAGVASAAVAV